MYQMVQPALHTENCGQADGLVPILALHKLGDAQRRKSMDGTCSDTGNRRVSFPTAPEALNRVKEVF